MSHGRKNPAGTPPRNRKGDLYKPATIRAYEIGLRLRVLPEVGSMRLSEVTSTDLQDLVDGLLASGLSESAIGVTLLPLRVIYKRALARPETGIAVNPTSDLEMPAVSTSFSRPAMASLRVRITKGRGSSSGGSCHHTSPRVGVTVARA